MSDRTSAGIFSEIFTMLANLDPKNSDKVARRIYKMTQGYDFSQCQMDCDDELVALGLAKEGAFGDIDYKGQDYGKY